MNCSCCSKIFPVASLSSALKKVETKFEGISRIALAILAKVGYFLSLTFCHVANKYSIEQWEKGVKLLFPSHKKPPTTPNSPAIPPTISTQNILSAIEVSIKPKRLHLSKEQLIQENIENYNFFVGGAEELKKKQKIGQACDFRRETNIAIIQEKSKRHLLAAKQQKSQEKPLRFEYNKSEEGCEISVSEHSSGAITCSSPGGAKNFYKMERNTYMEDVSLVDIFSYQGNEAYIYGVFDGHSCNKKDGKTVAGYVAKNISETLQRRLKKEESLLPANQTDLIIWNALKLAFVDLHNKLASFPLNDGGTTAIVALIFRDKLWIACTGDSRAMLNNGGDAIQVSEDANPDLGRVEKQNPNVLNNYEKGVLKRGGFIGMGNRLFGLLAIIRAIGDHNIPGITPRPKISFIPLSDIKPNSHLILVSDGLTKEASTEQLVAAVRDNANKDNLSTIAKNIVSSSIAAGSTDNQTMILVNLNFFLEKLKTDTKQYLPNPAIKGSSFAFDYSKSVDPNVNPGGRAGWLPNHQLLNNTRS